MYNAKALLAAASRALSKRLYYKKQNNQLTNNMLQKPKKAILVNDLELICRYCTQFSYFFFEMLGVGAGLALYFTFIIIDGLH